MRKPLDPISQIRWLECLNGDVTQIPAHGLVGISAVSIDGILTVLTPSADGQDVLVNGPCPIPASGRGAVTADSPVYALYETGDGTPAVGETWGAGAASYKLRKNKNGRKIYGGVTAGRVVIGVPGLGTAILPASAARVYNSGALSIPDTTPTALTFNSEAFDTDNYHSTSSNTGRLTAPTSGYYVVGVSIDWSSNSTGYRAVVIRKNGANYITGSDQVANAAAFGGTNQNCSAVINLTAGDYVTVEAQQTSGGNLNINATADISPFFWIGRLGS